jgi:hypothetical protein
MMAWVPYGLKGISQSAGGDLLQSAYINHCKEIHFIVRILIDNLKRQFSICISQN